MVIGEVDLENPTDILPEEQSAVIARMVAEAEAAPEPGSLYTGQALKDVDTGSEATEGTAQVVRLIKSAGYVTVYDSRTGASSLCNRNMLTAIFAKTYPDAPFERVFLTKPTKIPKRGSILCFLNSGHPENKQYADMGFPTCRGRHIPSGYALRRHMEGRHRSEWAAIKEEKAEQRDQTRRRYEDSISRIMERLALGGNVAQNEIPVMPTDSVEEAQAAAKPETMVQEEREAMVRVAKEVAKEEDPDAPVLHETPCEIPGCGEVFTAKSRVGTYPKRKKHMKEVHPEAEEGDDA